MNVQFNKSTTISKGKSLILLIIITIATLIGGILFLKSDTKLKKQCTFKTNAIVSDFKENSDSDATAAVYTYSMDGNEYTVTSNVYSSSHKFRIGDNVEFYVDPSDPHTFYCPKDISGRFFAVILFIVSGLCLLFSVFTAFQIIKERSSGSYGY